MEDPEQEQQEQPPKPEFAQFADMFVDTYYNIQNSDNKDELRAVYFDKSLLTIKQDQLVGVDAIMEKLGNGNEQLAPMKKIPVNWIPQPVIDPSSGEQTNELIISVYGNLSFNNFETEDGVMPFFEVFFLQIHEGNFIIRNQVFTPHTL